MHTLNTREDNPPRKTASPELELFQPCPPVNVPFLLPVRGGQLPLSGPPSPLVSESLILVRRVVKRLGGWAGGDREGERQRERVEGWGGGGRWRMEGGRAA